MVQKKKKEIMSLREYRGALNAVTSEVPSRIEINYKIVKKYVLDSFDKKESPITSLA